MGVWYWHCRRWVLMGIEKGQRQMIARDPRAAWTLLSLSRCRAFLGIHQFRGHWARIAEAWWVWVFFRDENYLDTSCCLIASSTRSHLPRVSQFIYISCTTVYITISQHTKLKQHQKRLWARSSLIGSGRSGRILRQPAIPCTLEFSQDISWQQWGRVAHKVARSASEQGFRS